MDEPHAAHVGREWYTCRRLTGQSPGALGGVTQVGKDELVGVGRSELVLLHIDPSDPTAFGLQAGDEVRGDEAAGAADQNLALW